LNLDFALEKRVGTPKKAIDRAKTKDFRGTLGFTDILLTFASKFAIRNIAG